MDTKSLADKISAAIPSIKAGALRMWGEWFGRPYDNMHRIIGCSAVGSALIVDFNDGETLTIENPVGLEVNKNLFSIRSASSVRWEWFYYGRPHTDENRYHYTFSKRGSTIYAESNVDWCDPALSPSAAQKAVELL
jgi:hypothetical protein